MGLINLWKLQSKPTKELHFTRFHLLKVLGWPTNGVYYERVKSALKRLEGVQLDFERAYWSDEEQSFVDRTFSLYNDLKIREDENSSSEKPDPRQPVFSFASCKLTWSEFLFDGLGERKLKHLDYDFYKSLSTAISKRLFRFLDKRLYNQRHSLLRMPLETFAVSHIGLAGGQPERAYKRRLKPALAELESRGFIKPVEDEERFRFLKRGMYEIFIERNFADAVVQAPPPEQEPPPSQIVVSLIEAGMHAKEAMKVVKSVPESDIRRKLDILKWRMESGDPPRNPGGWLNDLLQNKYPEPEGYNAHLKARDEKQSKTDQRKKNEAQKIERERQAKEATDTFLVMFQAWWLNLKEKERSEVDALILTKEQNDFDRRYLDEGEKTSAGRAIWGAHRQRIFSERTGVLPPGT